MFISNKYSQINYFICLIILRKIIKYISILLRIRFYEKVYSIIIFQYYYGLGFMKKFILLFTIFSLVGCNLYVSDKVSILMFNEDANGNEITNETLNFILVKRDDTNSFNNITYISGTIINKRGNQNITNITEAQYIKDINNTNSVQNLNLDNYNMTINYSKKSIIFTDDDGTKYTLPLNNSEDTWFYKLIKGSTNS